MYNCGIEIICEQMTTTLIYIYKYQRCAWPSVGIDHVTCKVIRGSGSCIAIAVRRSRGCNVTSDVTITSSVTWWFNFLLLFQTCFAVKLMGWKTWRSRLGSKMPPALQNYVSGSVTFIADILTAAKLWIVGLLGCDAVWSVYLVTNVPPKRL